MDYTDNGANIIRNDTDKMDNMILSLLKEYTYLQRGDLIKKLEKIIGESISRTTLHRHLNYLVKEKQIIHITHKDFVKFGIQDSKRSVYYALQDYEQIPKYYDLVISQLKSSDPKERDNALIEIESMDTIRLLPHQLIELSDLMLKEEPFLGLKILRILFNNFKSFNFPSDLEKFQKNLIDYYEKVKKDIDIAQNFPGNARIHEKQMIFFMLGILDNPIILKYLKEDILEKSDEFNQTVYKDWAVARIIDKNKADLLEFQTHLIPENQRTLRSIRSQASQNLFNNDNLKNFREKLKELG